MSKTPWPFPVMGAVTLEVIKVDVKSHLDKKNEIKEKSSFLADKGFEVVYGTTETDHQTGESKFKMYNDNFGTAPYQKGKVVEMAVDCFGYAFEHNYGRDCADFMRKNIKKGTVVWFIPNSSYQIDAAGNYHMIPDEKIKAIENE